MDGGQGRRRQSERDGVTVTSERIFTTETTHGSSSSRSVSFGFGGGAPDGMFASSAHSAQFDHGLGDSYGWALDRPNRFSRGAGNHRGFSGGQHPDIAQARGLASSNDAMDRMTTLSKRDQWIRILFALFFIIGFAFFLYAVFSGGSSQAEQGSQRTSSWCIWIPLGPWFWVGYGSEGFQWSFQFTLYL
ncbi:hypothetical protein GQ53DRAFT_450352 [Thozetella sp. PMI_491]|nr:hypothetical protein GQ53DRAFT_450352 [Thozetella sp. PMI_491]